MISLPIEKPEVPRAFDRVAGAYDLLTAMNPGYRTHLRYSARRLRLPARARILDLCCGTGLSTEALLEAYPDAAITALDGSPEMLRKAQEKPWAAQVSWVQGDAMDPAASGVTGPFDGVLMAYGIRNVTDPDLCLQRLFGLLAPGGRICLHEYSVRGSRYATTLWNAVTLGVIIPSGAALSHGSDLYRYLRRSVLSFDSVSQLERRMRWAGFRQVHTEPMSGWQRGIVHSFLGARPTARG
jgi:ubiquinone/menaquinone biosynthesis C-methylase UbiE